MLPLFVTEIVAVTGWPAFSAVNGEFGSPLAVTAGALNETVPVNGSLRCAPSIAPVVTNDTVHRPGTGVRRKNCMVAPGLFALLAVDWRSSPWSKGGMIAPWRM